MSPSLPNKFDRGWGPYHNSKHGLRPSQNHSHSFFYRLMVLLGSLSKWYCQTYHPLTIVQSDPKVETVAMHIRFLFYILLYRLQRSVSSSIHFKILVPRVSSAAENIYKTINHRSFRKATLVTNWHISQKQLVVVICI